MRGVRRVVLVGMLAVAGCAGVDFPTCGPRGLHEGLCGGAPAMPLVPEATRTLPGLWRRSGTGFQLAPGIEYNDLTITDRNDNKVNIQLVGFGLTNYVEPVPVDAGPIFLESLFSQSSWWAAFAGPATMETETGDYSGHYVRVEALAMGSNRLGARAGYTYADTMAHEAEVSAAQFAVLYDYVPGGRVSARIAEERTDLLIVVHWVTSTLAFGADWGQFWNLPGGGAAGLGYSWTRREYTYGDSQPNQVDEIGGVYYPVKEFGLAAGGAWARGDQEEADEWRAGIRLDLEQVGLSVDFTRRTKFEPAPGTDDMFTVKLEMRF